MKKLSTEKMENVEGGDVCDALLYAAFSCDSCNQAFLLNTYFDLGCHMVE